MIFLGLQNEASNSIEKVFVLSTLCYAELANRSIATRSIAKASGIASIRNSCARSVFSLFNGNLGFRLIDNRTTGWVQ